MDSPPQKVVFEPFDGTAGTHERVTKTWNGRAWHHQDSEFVTLIELQEDYELEHDVSPTPEEIVDFTDGDIQVLKDAVDVARSRRGGNL